MGRNKDRYGMPRVLLNRKTIRHEYESIRETLRIFAGQLGAYRKGRIRFNLLPRDMVRSNAAAYHHMGTTRMHNNPQWGVTDRFGRVHGMENFFIGGSSLFTTSGSAHPTVNLLALAFWSAQYLKEEIIR